MASWMARAHLRRLMPEKGSLLPGPRRGLASVAAVEEAMLGERARPESKLRVGSLRSMV